MLDKTKNIVICGEAGQGLITIGKQLTKAFVRAGYRVHVTQGYESRIRGGHNTFAIRVGQESVLSPKDGIDLLVPLNRNSIDIHSDEILASGRVLSDISWDLSSEKEIAIPYGELASKKYMNTVALGIASALLGLRRDDLVKIIGESFSKKGAEVIADNVDALDKAYGWVKDGGPSFEALPPVEARRDRIMLNGNEAIALGAISAGLKFCSFYPMTPATSICLTLAKHAEKMGLVVEQVEDEISAINMAIGASYAGAPSMVASSGGGFALMAEGVSLAGMTETPIVIAISQRPGPATGLPTRTEQADLEFALHSGHGEFPRAIFAPSDVTDCFSLTRKAFEVAEDFQSPVFILTDQYLADSYRALDSIDASSPTNPELRRNGASPSTPYKRYALTENGVSPRLIPGESEDLVVVDSDEHTEYGHLTEELSVRISMMNKRLKKFDGISAEVIAPKHTGGTDADLLLVSWGSTGGAVLDAASEIGARGENVATLHFSQVWPLVESQFIDLLKSASKVICIEGNATGQLAKLIRRETGFNIESKVLRYDGLPITAGYILDQIEMLRGASNG
jgi:2-oxoglutarate/2-oxoacid ferredoxin oxidoreductase subunit alpha